mmetsp:Transcript_12561/g.36778  ORF Transcript_12561/g.36778 Transcript_12561/m.36778 type:complete len:201 (-) Transcript_12561:230-832(-)
MDATGLGRRLRVVFTSPYGTGLEVFLSGARRAYLRRHALRRRRARQVDPSSGADFIEPRARGLGRREIARADQRARALQGDAARVPRGAASAVGAGDREAHAGGLAQVRNLSRRGRLGEEEARLRRRPRRRRLRRRPRGHGAHEKLVWRRRSRAGVVRHRVVLLRNVERRIAQGPVGRVPGRSADVDAARSFGVLARRPG